MKWLSKLPYRSITLILATLLLLYLMVDLTGLIFHVILDVWQVLIVVFWCIIFYVGLYLLGEDRDGNDTRNTRNVRRNS